MPRYTFYWNATSFIYMPTCHLHNSLLQYTMSCRIVSLFSFQDPSAAIPQRTVYKLISIAARTTTLVFKRARHIFSSELLLMFLRNTKIVSFPGERSSMDWSEVKDRRSAESCMDYGALEQEAEVIKNKLIEVCYVVSNKSIKGN